MFEVAKFIKKFRKAESGSFAATFAVGVLTIVLLAGAAVDVNHATKTKKQL